MAMVIPGDNGDPSDVDKYGADLKPQPTAPDGDDIATEIMEPVTVLIIVNCFYRLTKAILRSVVVLPTLGVCSFSQKKDQISYTEMIVVKHCS